MKNYQIKKEVILIIAVLAIAAVFFLINYIIAKKPASMLQVTVDGSVVHTLPLNKDADLIIEGYQNGTNHLLIKDGKASVTEATCPDKVCVRQGQVSHTGEVIVCLPNKMIATVVGES